MEGNGAPSVNHRLQSATRCEYDSEYLALKTIGSSWLNVGIRLLSPGSQEKGSYLVKCHIPEESTGILRLDTSFGLAYGIPGPSQCRMNGILQWDREIIKSC